MNYFSRLSILLLGSFVLLIAGCHNKPAPADKGLATRMLDLRLDATDAALKGNFERSDSLGHELYKTAAGVGDDVNAAYGLLSQGYYNKTHHDAANRLEKVKQAEKLALSTDNDTLLSRVYNALGMYATMENSDFSIAKHYYTEAIRYAQRGKLPNLVVAWECNIAELYYIFECIC